MAPIPSLTRAALTLAAVGTLALGAQACTETEGAIGGNRDLSDVDFSDYEDTGDDTEDVMDEAEPDVVEDASCLRDGDCEPPEVCLVDRSDPEMPTMCGGAAGEGGTGDACTEDADCASNLCLDGRCAPPCSADSDCPEGFACEDRMIADAITIAVCVPDECGSLDACGDDDVCQADRGDMTLEFTCRPPDNEDGAGLGEDCEEDADCLTSFCEGGRCSAPCSDSDDCPADVPLNCETQMVEVDNATVEADICTGPPECERGDDCDAGVCFFWPTDAELLTFCDEGNDPADPPGYLCGDDDDCVNGLCLGGQCVSPCVETDDCDAGLVCTSRVVELEDENVEANVCATPPEDACGRDADCDAPDLCVARRRGDRVDFVCGDGNDGGGETGDDCSEDADCLHNLCRDGECTAPCGVDNDCDASDGEICATLPAEVDDGEVEVDVCTFPEPCLAARQCDNGETCYVRHLEGGAVDTVCLPPNDDGRSDGSSCEEDRRCLANLCLDGWLADVCSTPCETSDDCSITGYTCVERQLTDNPDSTTTICVPPNPDPCQSNGDCSNNQICSIVVNRAGDGLETVCINPVGPEGPEDPCDADADCRTGICLDGTCSAICRDRDTDCGDDQICEELPVSEGGFTEDFNLCRTLEDTACDATDQCPDGVRVCGDIRFEEPTQPYCIWPQEGGDPIGTACEGTRSPSDQCADRICLTPYTNECTTTCVDTQDCADADSPAGFVCTDFRLGGDAVRMCAQQCGADSECTDRDDHLCGLSRNVTDDRYLFICRSAMGDNPTGTDCSETINCTNGLCLTRTVNSETVEEICTQPCINDDDCPDGNWVCGDANISRPQSGTNQSVRVCTRPTGG